MDQDLLKILLIIFNFNLKLNIIEFLFINIRFYNLIIYQIYILYKNIFFILYNIFLLTKLI